MNELNEKINELSLDKRELFELLQRENQSSETNGYVLPRNATEKTLTEIWADVLELERIGVDDNFFELGGDSIQGMQIAVKARHAGIILTTNELFENPTVAGQARIAGLKSGEEIKRKVEEKSAANLDDEISAEDYAKLFGAAD